MKTSSRRAWRALLAASACLAIVSVARAEDIDIYSLPPSAADLPNVLFMIDNSANWSADLANGYCTQWPDSGAAVPNADNSKKSGAQICALVTVVERLAARAAANGGNPVARIGVMMFNSGSSKVGAYPRINFTAVTPANKAALQTKLKTISRGGDTAAAAPDVGLGMYEAYLWFKGEPAQYGRDTSSFDPNAFVSGSTQYSSPASASCGRNFIIFISNGDPATQTQTVNAERAFLQQFAANTTAIPAPSGVNNPTRNLFASWGDEYARELLSLDFSSRDGAQSITTFGVAVIGANSDPNNTTNPPFSGFFSYVDSMARYGGSPRYLNGSGRPSYFYPALGPGAIADAVDAIFGRILSANTVFTSAALPISVSTQGTYKNQVFIGMFRPDETMQPRWYGNVKQYKFAYDDSSGALSLVDSAGNAAVSTITGYVESSAVSYWTRSSTFWVNAPRGGINPASDSPDGEVTEKGGAAQRQREAFATSQSGRNVYTCVGCATNTALSTNSAAQFATGNSAISASALGVSSSDRDELIEWVRGTNNVDGDGGGAEEAGPTTGPATTVRPSIHGDVLHSRPAVIDYGGSTGVVIFYGANDGTLRAVGGEQTGADAGRELWAFVPEEMFGKLKRLRNNWPEVKYPNNPDSTATRRDYFVDGPITVLRNGSTGEVIIYVAMRRGGKFIYAIDVSNPAAPRYKWRFGPGQFSAIGQTWSEPRLAMLRGHANPVIVMGAGYDAAAEDASPRATTTMGNAVLVIDAYTGALVGSLSTLGSVPGAVTLVDIDSDGYVDRAYLGDARANAYRIDFENGSGGNAPQHWTITRLAALAVENAERKFLYEPDVVITKTRIAILFGSGDRERPLLGRMPYPGTSETDTKDGLITLFDAKRTKGAPTVASPATASDLVTHGSFATTENPKGCFFPLPFSAIGEKTVNAGLTVAGRTLFSTNTPAQSSANQCGSLGTARTYAIPLFCGTIASVDLLNGGLPPTPVSGLVDMGNGVIQRFLIGGAPPGGAYGGSRSSIGASRPTIAVDNTRRRTYWYPNRSR